MVRNSNLKDSSHAELLIYVMQIIHETQAANIGRILGSAEYLKLQDISYRFLHLLIQPITLPAAVAYNLRKLEDKVSLLHQRLIELLGSADSRICTSANYIVSQLDLFDLPAANECMVYERSLTCITTLCLDSNQDDIRRMDLEFLVEDLKALLIAVLDNHSKVVLEGMNPAELLIFNSYRNSLEKNMEIYSYLYSSDVLPD